MTTIDNKGLNKPVNGIHATWQHDEGAMAQCSYCRRYTLDSNALTHRKVVCDCGRHDGWSGSFRRPDEDAKYSALTEAQEGKASG